MSDAITKNNNPGADAAMTGVMNAMGQDGNYGANRLPIKNRINALDVSINSNTTSLAHCSHFIPLYQRNSKEAIKLLNDNKKEV